MKLPLISAWPLGIALLTVGAEMTLPSRTIANCFCWPDSELVWLAIAWVTFAKILRASLLNVRLTVHCTFCWLGGVACALLSWVPSMSGVESSSLLPSSSQVISGLVLSSLTGLVGPFLGQVNVENFCSQGCPGCPARRAGRRSEHPSW